MIYNHFSWPIILYRGSIINKDFLPSASYFLEYCDHLKGTRYHHENI